MRASPGPVPAMGVLLTVCFGACQAATTRTPPDCASWARAMCADYMRCKPDYVFMEFGDPGACDAQLAVECSAKSQAPGSGVSVDWVKACAAALEDPGLSCDVFLNEMPPACATPSGTLPSGAGCAYNEQCSGGALCGGEGPLCGQCGASFSGIGSSSCGVNEQCPQGQSCVAYSLVGPPAVNSSCAPPNPLGSACCPDCFGVGNPSPCRDGLACVGAMLPTMPGTCVEASALGAACTFPPYAASDPCDVNHELRCASGNCSTSTYASAGQRCGTGTPGAPVACLAGYCDRGTCLPLGRLGDACAVTECMRPYVCLSSTSKCQLPDGSGCPGTP